jgi:hypothetical protein
MRQPGSPVPRRRSLTRGGRQRRASGGPLAGLGTRNPGTLANPSSHPLEQAGMPQATAGLIWAARPYSFLLGAEARQPDKPQPTVGVWMMNDGWPPVG